MKRRAAFTLIELLTVIAIISLLISILLPSLSRAREQAKCLRCQASLHEFGIGIATYENQYRDALPPAAWIPDKVQINGVMTPNTGSPPFIYGWAELLWAHAYSEKVKTADNFPAQRNIGGEDRWQKYLECASSTYHGANSGHYRVYLPSWVAGTYSVNADGTFCDPATLNPTLSAVRSNIRPRLPLIGDANEQSERGDGVGNDECSYINAGEANTAGTGGYNGNRFSDRHSGGTNYLFADLHAERDTQLRHKLDIDWDLNEVNDIDIQP
ncbi:MAG TPA: prepilin-type N-terminal cleavage/methylation domain-containing protein [Phycisphaerae bacterium]|jgi:prepilin-type N-terminal cleavage/methylation domain-containing protein/prepilin-type processing-associated H-X9-DG protein